jgi:LysR family transcriptional activator of glutamate synthase operon
LAEIIQMEQGVVLLPISVCRKYNLNYVKIANMPPTYTVGLSGIKDFMSSATIRQLRDFIISHFNDNNEDYKS